MRVKDCGNCMKGGFLKCQNQECLKSGEFKNFEPANDYVAKMMEEGKEANRKAFMKILGID